MRNPNGLNACDGCGREQDEGVTVSQYGDGHLCDHCLAMQSARGGVLDIAGRKLSIMEARRQRADPAVAAALDAAGL